MKRKNKTIQQIKLLLFSIIQAAVCGNVMTIDIVLKHYEGYILSLSTRRMYDENGQQFFGIDESLKRRLEIKLITKILDFEII